MRHHCRESMLLVASRQLSFLMGLVLFPQGDEEQEDNDINLIPDRYGLLTANGYDGGFKGVYVIASAPDAK